MRRTATGTATVGAGGSATVFVSGPVRPRSSWLLSTVNVTSTPTGAGEFPTCDVYRGAVAASSKLGHSRSADEVTFECDPGDRLLAGEQLIVVLDNAAVGSTVIVNVFADEVME